MPAPSLAGAMGQSIIGAVYTDQREFLAMPQGRIGQAWGPGRGCVRPLAVVDEAKVHVLGEGLSPLQGGVVLNDILLVPGVLP
jgi:hypothetical protein